MKARLTRWNHASRSWKAKRQKLREEPGPNYARNCPAGDCKDARYYPAGAGRGDYPDHFDNSQHRAHCPARSARDLLHRMDAAVRQRPMTSTASQSVCKWRPGGKLLKTQGRVDLSLGFRYTIRSMPMRKIHLKSFGCQMNKLDSSLASVCLSWLH